MEKQEHRKLKRSIGLWSAVAINVGAIIGGGIFVVTGIVAGYAGSALIISMIIAGIIAFITATSFARLTAWQPVEGGVYEYGRQLISPFYGFLGRLDVASRKHFHWSSGLPWVCLLLDSGFPWFTDQFSCSILVFGFYRVKFGWGKRIIKSQQCSSQH